MAGQPPKYKNAEELQKKVDEYFESLIVTDADGAFIRENPALITGIALHLGFCSRQSFYDYEKLPEYSYTIKTARLRVEAGYETNLAGKSPTGAIFALKNMGWQDKQEIHQTVDLGGPININIVRGNK